MKPILVAAFLLLFIPAAMAAQPLSLTIRTASGKTQVFHVQQALTPEEQEKGLMFVPAMPADQGMLFDFHRVEPIRMWMKNTLISLDMLFIAEDGRIVGIARNAVPKSLDIIGPPEPVRAVLEVNGGICERLGIAVGDRVTEPTFSGATSPDRPDTSPQPRSSDGRP